MLAGTKLLRRLAAAPALTSVIDSEIEPGTEAMSDDAPLTHIRQRGSTVFHPVSTCRMGPDPRACVVDPTLKVHGLDGLRIVDASVFPTLTSSNTNAPTIMVAEKAADLVSDDARA